ncbi:DUF3558 domain-containing protein [Kutzneria buriramensis]|uniref:Uncharacterized protein DUF3558 n=1 Tax=Kutzneria buriramensis TaxID=1045776 RepID=A0A3E0H003_9PSEU|nr:DUF3558 domain-containing protein [Kutzneria buriramensis]REH35731.1 uncharacterized protein DUF3558 [Kutzneria buriramensis]
MAGAVLMMTGCSNPPSIGGTAGPSSASSTDTAPPGVPNVAHPLDTAAFQKAPCSVLTAAQLQQLTITAAGKPDLTDPLGPVCHWDNQTGPSKMDLAVYIVTAGQGLAGIYSQKDTYQVFQPLPDIEGYPAVTAQNDDPKQGNCVVSVGVSNALFVNVLVNLKTGVDAAPDMTNPCPRNRTVAEAVVATIKAGK